MSFLGLESCSSSQQSGDFVPLEFAFDDVPVKESATKKQRLGETQVSKTPSLVLPTPVWRNIIMMLYAAQEVGDQHTSIFHAKEIRALACSSVALRDIAQPFMRVSRQTNQFSVAMRTSTDALQIAERQLKQTIHSVLISENSLRYMGALPSILPNLRHISFALSMPPVRMDEGFVQQCLTPLKQLASIDLSRCDFGRLSGLKLLPNIRAIHTMPADSLRPLFNESPADLHLFQSPGDAVRQRRDLASAAPRCPFLTTAALKEIVSANPQIQVLHLGFYHFLDFYQCEAIRLISTLTNLRELTLSGMTIHTALDDLKTLTELRKLNILSSGLSEADIAQCALQFPLLESLCIPCGQSVTGDLFAELAGCANLQELALGFSYEQEEFQNSITQLNKIAGLKKLSLIERNFRDSHFQSNISLDGLKPLELLKLRAHTDPSGAIAYKKQNPASIVVLNGDNIT